MRRILFASVAMLNYHTGRLIYQLHCCSRRIHGHMVSMSLVYPIAVVDILVVDIVSFDVDCSEHVSLADDVLAMLNCIFAAVVSDIVIIRSEVREWFLLP